MKRVAVVGAGGTIAMQGAHRFDWIDYGDTGIINPIAELLPSMEFGLPDIEAVPVEFRMLGSTGISVADWLELRCKVNALMQEGGFDGIVITHGTATLEETAFFLSMTHTGNLPVVICGAQRPPNTEGSDAVSNLRSALIAAAQAPRGTYVVMNGYLYDPATVSKTGNFALDAFEDKEFGPLGRIDPGGELKLRRWLNDDMPRFDVAEFSTSALPRVDLVYSYAGADATLIDACIQAGAKAIISAGFPPGRCTPEERAALIEAAKAGILVVQTSRAARGAVPIQPYNSEKGILAGGILEPHKVRIAVMLALAAELEPGEIQALLAKF